jgi:hypothetical protein
MLLDASAARSIAVLGWIDQLAYAVGESLHVAHGVLAEPPEPSELQRIRDAMHREANMSRPGSGRYSRALAAMHELDKLLKLPPTITLVFPNTDEIRMAARLTSREPAERAWRCGLGLRARWLDAGEAVSIAVAQARALSFASDDEQALVAYTALTGRPAVRTRDLIYLLVSQGLIEEAEGHAAYRLLREDDLHLLGGPEW